MRILNLVALAAVGLSVVMDPEGVPVLGAPVTGVAVGEPGVVVGLPVTREGMPDGAPVDFSHV